MRFTSPFLFTVCQVGAEKALKAEIARDYPELRFAFSRPGFLTFKKAEGEITTDFELKSVFARAYGVCHGKKSLADAQKFIPELRAQDPRVKLHAWERDRYAPGETPKGFEPGSWVKPLIKALKVENSPAEDGDTICDLIAVEEDEYWVGVHQHSHWHSPYAGGRPEIAVPKDAPSRAYLKLEEGILWSGAPLRKGDIAVEIGSAPGGASYSLIRRGLNVLGIDPAEMDPKILKSPQYKHISRPVNQVLREELPNSVEWLLLDMNVAPNVSIFAMDRLASRMIDTLLGVLLTVKLNDWKIAAEIPSILEHVRAIGMSKVRATQLASNGQEIFVYGLTRKGKQRLSNQKSSKS